VGFPAVGFEADHSPGDRELAVLFHRLNNQLGIVLANAELLESKAADAADRSRAAHLVAGTLSAIATVRELRQRIGPDRELPR
jgi:hypothetical protein